MKTLQASHLIMAVAAGFLLVLLPHPAFATERPDGTDGEIRVRLLAESGFLGVLDHRIKYAENESSFRYHKEGGQDVLFPFVRLSVELDVADRNTVIFLYQPLRLETRAEMPEGLTIGGEEFSGDTLDLLYSFPFYRLSYLREVYRGPRLHAAFGGSLQIRNAAIEFEGSQGGFFRSAGVGPVPLLKARARYDLPGNFWLESEIDGIYAPISYINGSDNDTVGALLEANMRAGYTIGPSLQTFLNVRYLGGGAANEDPGDYSVNWLNVMTLSLGVSLSLM